VKLTHKKSASYTDDLMRRLQDPAHAAAFLTAAAEDSEPVVYLTALRLVAQSKGFAQVALAAGLPRESVYRALSPKGNPRWSTLAAILRGTGLQLNIRPV
jgi:probable addiction module antidote protein